MRAKDLQFLIAALMVVGTAAASDPVGLKMGHSDSSPPAEVHSARAVLHDQTDNSGTDGAPAQFFTDFGGGAYAADDFVVPAPGWAIEQIVALGSYSGASAPTWDVVIYDDAGGLPGTVVFSQTGITATADVAGDVTLDLAPVASLSAGTYWLSVVANLSFSGANQWFWSSRTVQTGAPYHWEDRDALFGIVACSTWGPGASTCGVGSAGEPDLLFSLGGVLVPVELQSLSIE